MRVFESISEWRTFRGQMAPHLTMGFVPTMGALHAGHESLVQKSSSENEHTLVSIFVNPTQFNQSADFSNYPKTLEADLELLKRSGTSFVLLPQESELYPDGYRYRVVENQLSLKWCGAHRVGHFEGVLSVVLKLLNIAKAHRAYFGEKDYQQLQLVRGMVQAFFIDTVIVGCPTIRETDGLAMSSRNTRLTETERSKATFFSQTLLKSKSTEEAKELLERAGFKVDYVEESENRRLGAIHLGSVRLIDNVELN